MKKITLSVNELSELLNVSTGTIYTMVRENQIPSFSVRGRILFNHEVIVAWTKGDHQSEEQAIV